MYSIPPPPEPPAPPTQPVAPLVAQFPWQDTPLGAREDWPAYRQAIVSLMLSSRVPMATIWGPEGTLIYNDGYAVIAGARHPHILGARVRDAWPEAADFNGQVLETCLAGGTASYRDQRFLLYRGAAAEEVFLDLDYSPMRDAAGRPAGALAIVVETTAKVRAEQRVLGERERLANMFAQAPGFMAVLRGPEHVFDLANPAYLQLVGHRDVLGKPVREALPEIEGQGFLALLDRVYRSGEAFRGTAVPTMLHRRPGGAEEMQYVDLLYHPLRDASGAVAGIFVQGADVTERVLAEAELKKRDRQFQVFAQAMPNQVWAADVDGLLDWVNDKICQYSGFTVEQTLGSGWAAMVHPEDLPMASERWAQARASRTPYETEFRLRRFDGVYRWHLARAVPLQEADGTRWVGTNTDIQDQRAASEALALLNENLEQQVAERTAERDRIWRLSTELMLVADFQGTIVSVNPAWTRVLAWSTEELLGRAFMELVHPEDRAATLAEMDRLRQGHTTLRFENRYRRKDGHYRLVMWAAVPDEGYVHAVGRDVTGDRQAAEALRATEAALHQAQKMESVGQLTGGVAHDFNNVLQIIAGNLHLLRRAVAADPLAQRRLGGALAGVERGAKLASHLLAFARRQPLSPVVLNVGRLLRDLDDMLRRALGGAIEMETVVAGGLWNTLVDPSFLESSLLNLAINARDAMEGQGRLTIEAGNARLDDAYVRANPEAAPGQYVMIAVTDTGSGMPPEVLGKVFEPFFTTKTAGRGTGLGLSMVYGFVKQSGGHVNIYSEPGHGTTVRLYLPRSTEAELLAVPLLSAPAEGGSETVLVVEDDAEVRETVVELLSDLGYKVLKAGDAQSALAIVESGLPIDLLFTDVVMPGPLRSPELARRARLAQPRMEVLFTSGYTENSIVHGGRLDRGVALLSKPYARDELARKLRQMLSRRSQEAAAGQPGAAPAEAAIPAAEPGGAESRRILVVEDNEDALMSTVELLTYMGHRPLGAASSEAALEILREHTLDVLMTDLQLPVLPGQELARQACVIQPHLQVIIASGKSAFDIGLPQATWLTKPFGPQEITQALDRGLRGNAGP